MKKLNDLLREHPRNYLAVQGNTAETSGKVWYFAKLWYYVGVEELKTAEAWGHSVQQAINGALEVVGKFRGAEISAEKA